MEERKLTADDGQQKMDKEFKQIVLAWLCILSVVMTVLILGFNSLVDRRIKTLFFGTLQEIPKVLKVADK